MRAALCIAVLSLMAAPGSSIIGRNLEPFLHPLSQGILVQSSGDSRYWAAEQASTSYITSFDGAKAEASIFHPRAVDTKKFGKVVSIGCKGSSDDSTVIYASGKFGWYLVCDSPASYSEEGHLFHVEDVAGSQDEVIFRSVIDMNIVRMSLPYVVVGKSARCLADQQCSFKLSSPSMKPEELRITRAWADLSAIPIGTEDFVSTVVNRTSVYNFGETSQDVLKELSTKWSFPQTTVWKSRLGQGNAGSIRINLPEEMNLLPESFMVTADFSEGVVSSSEERHMGLSGVIKTQIPAKSKLDLQFLVWHSKHLSVPVVAEFARTVWDVYTVTPITTRFNSTGIWHGSLVSNTQLIPEITHLTPTETATEEEEGDDHPSWHHTLANLAHTVLQHHEADDSPYQRSHPMLDVIGRGLQVFWDY